MAKRPAQENPFATRYLQQLHFLETDESIASLVSRFEQMHRRAAIVGPEGHGKTTMQQAIAAHYGQQGTACHWVRLTEERPHLPRTVVSQLQSVAGENDLILVDGAE